MSSFIPESAPFNDEQRAWLNGFFSGLMGIRPDLSPSDALQAAGIASESIAVAGPPEEETEEEEDFPWHDSALPIVDRMELAAGKPLERQLMAAMAQLDCGSCGYLCQSYSEAIASGEETNLTLCSPGGKETKQTIKKLLKESNTESSVRNGAAANGNAANGKTSRDAMPDTSQWSRRNPFPAKLVESRPLNKEGSAKDTRHVVIDLDGSQLTYEVGDALGVYPTNCPDLVQRIVQTLRADVDLAVDSPLGTRKSLAAALTEDCCLKDPTDELIELLCSYTKQVDSKALLESMLDNGVPDGCDVLDVLEIAGDATFTATEFVATLCPLNPRLYSIASSMNSVGSQVHLTVGKVAYDRGDRLRKGVASTMLAERVRGGDVLRVFVQPNHGGFTVPPDSNAPMIMIGPGTGIAPFIAFLQERHASKANGPNWLFFGDQHRETDFLYEDLLHQYQTSGLLTRLDTAFSRDGETKVYVQDRIRENAAEIWSWMQKGAYLFVCGDASRMAADVHEALIQVVAEQSNCSVEGAVQWIEQLKQAGRYARDVY